MRVCVRSCVHAHVRARAFVRPSELACFRAFVHGGGGGGGAGGGGGGVSGPHAVSFSGSI